jgi:hypothetical protein
MVHFLTAGRACQIPFQSENKKTQPCDRVLMLLTNQKTINYENLYRIRETTPGMRCKSTSILNDSKSKPHFNSTSAIFD